MGAARGLKNTGMTPGALKGRERQLFALSLRREGKHWDEVAAELGLRSPSAASNLVRRYLNKYDSPNAEDFRLEIKAQIDGILHTMLPQAQEGDTRAADVCVRCHARLASLFGLDAPTKIAGPDGGALMVVVEKLVSANDDNRDVPETGGIPTE